MLIAFCVILAAFIQGFCIFAGIFWLYHREKRRASLLIEEKLREWFTSAPGEPHQAAKVLDAAGAVIGHAAARSIMANLSQQAGAVANVANGVSDQLQAQSNPLVGLLTGGKRGKGAAIMRLAELLGPMLQGGNHGAPANSMPTRRHRE
jgi:hypothetical protein